MSRRGRRRRRAAAVAIGRDSVVAVHSELTWPASRSRPAMNSRIRARWGTCRLSFAGPQSMSRTRCSPSATRRGAEHQGPRPSDDDDGRLDQGEP
jgi:hypothetical protein